MYRVDDVGRTGAQRGVEVFVRKRTGQIAGRFVIYIRLACCFVQNLQLSLVLFLRLLLPDPLVGRYGEQAIPDAKQLVIAVVGFYEFALKQAD